MKNNFIKNIRNSLFLILILVVKGVIFFIPWKAGKFIFSRLAVFISYFLPGEKRKLHRNLNIVFGDSMTTAEKKKLEKANFKNYGIGAFEFLKFSMWKPEKISALVKETEGLEYMRESQNNKKGLIAVTAHMSNWEIQSIFLAHSGLKVGAVAKMIFDRRIDRIVNATRMKTGVSIYDKSGMPKEMIKELRQGLILGILADQDTSVESVFVPFLGKDAKTPVAPAKLAKKLDLTLVTAYAYRRPDGYYGFKVNKPIEVAGKTEEEIATEYNAQISEAILKYPEQWVWLHRRFRMTEEKKMEEAGIKL